MPASRLDALPWDGKQHPSSLPVPGKAASLAEEPRKRLPAEALAGLLSACGPANAAPLPERSVRSAASQHYLALAIHPRTRTRANTRENVEPRRRSFLL